MKSVLQDWVMGLPIRAQGTLLTGMRGGDMTPKVPGETSPERELHAFLRFCVLNPADGREIDTKGGWFKSTPPEGWKPSQFGHYPEHWYSHVMHCFEVIGYCHPDPQLATYGRDVYFRFVKNLHLSPESPEEMWERLTEDRIIAGTVVS